MIGSALYVPFAARSPRHVGDRRGHLVSKVDQLVQLHAEPLHLLAALLDLLLDPSRVASDLLVGLLRRCTCRLHALLILQGLLIDVVETLRLITSLPPARLSATTRPRRQYFRGMMWAPSEATEEEGNITIYTPGHCRPSPAQVSPPVHAAAMSGAMRLPISRGVSAATGLNPRLTSGQDVGHCDPAKLRPLEEKRDGLVRRENLDRTIPVGSRIGVDLDLAINQVDDPVARRRRPLPKVGSEPAVVAEARAGDLDDEGDAWAGLRMALIDSRARLPRATNGVRLRNARRDRGP